jgi:hypothetical protein
MNPGVTSIGGNAFAICYALATLNLPSVPPSLGLSVFANTNNGAGYGTTLTIHVQSPGTVSEYAGAWVVANPADAGTQTVVYGTSHKRVVITTP